MTTTLTRVIEDALGHCPPAMMDGSPEGGRLLAGYLASVLTEADGGTEHVVKVQGRDWIMSHPLPERFEPGGVLACTLNPLVTVAMAQRAMHDGTHRVSLDRGVLVWEEVDA